MRTLRYVFCAFAMFAAVASASAQAPVSATDIDRLEATAADVDRQIKGLERTDQTLASDAAKSLVDLRDEITYLRVKLRRDGAVTRTEYSDVRDRLETLKTRVLRGQPGSTTAAASGVAGRSRVVPVGTEIDVRLQTPLTSRTARVEQRFEATTILDLTQENTTVIPAGTLVRGFVSSVRPAGKIDRAGSLTLSFDELVIDQRVSRLRASVVKALDPKVNDDVSRIGAGAVVGAVIGGILGGTKGALLGVLIGGGGTIASTEGSDVDLPVGTVLRIRIDQPIEISSPRQGPSGGV